ncbi:hypothetical protein BKA65DRAFT_557962 [Rhexocercosporidium sp. MPI-PUGE-AT-0058]|nr:hypothetical protein BKA65DRAFT_557962 [Rhexocercosporidium sp. MPI-PUGE-AT-0058]
MGQQTFTHVPSGNQDNIGDPMDIDSNIDDTMPQPDASTPSGSEAQDEEVCPADQKAQDASIAVILGLDVMGQAQAVEQDEQDEQGLEPESPHPVAEMQASDGVYDLRADAAAFAALFSAPIVEQTQAVEQEQEQQPGPKAQGHESVFDDSQAKATALAALLGTAIVEQGEALEQKHLLANKSESGTSMKGESPGSSPSSVHTYHWKRIGPQRESRTSEDDTAEDEGYIPILLPLAPVTEAEEMIREACSLGILPGVPARSRLVTVGGSVTNNGVTRRRKQGNCGVRFPWVDRMAADTSDDSNEVIQPGPVTNRRQVPLPPAVARRRKGKESDHKRVLGGSKVIRL